MSDDEDESLWDVEVEQRPIDRDATVACLEYRALNQVPTTEPWLTLNDGTVIPPGTLMSIACKQCGSDIRLDR